MQQTSDNTSHTPASKSSKGLEVCPQPAPAGIFIIRGNRILYVSAGCEAISGYQRDELMALDFWEIFDPHSLESVPLREGDIEKESPTRVFRSYELKIITKRGEERWVRGKVTEIASDGKLAVLGTAFDITLRKRAEEYIRENWVRLKPIFEDAPLGMAFLGPDLCFLKVNPALCRMLGYTEGELLYRFFVEHTHPEDIQISVKSARQLVLGELPKLTAERRYLRKDGKTIWLQVTAGPIRDDQGRRLCGLAMFEDISHRKQVEAEKHEYSQRLLSTLEEERRHIARELHDDIGQSLAVLALQLRTLGHESSQLEQVGNVLDETVKKLEATAEAVARLARSYHPADLSRLGLEGALRSFTREWSHQHGVALELQVDYIAGTLTPQQELHFYRITQEALTNVARHANARRVRVILSRQGGKVTLSIEDDGSGVRASSPGRPTRGLGITTMRERAEIADGSLKIRNRANGGTQVEVMVCLDSGGE